MIGRMKGYKVAVVMPENVSVERVQLLEAYGAESSPRTARKAPTAPSRWPRTSSKSARTTT